MKQMTWEDIADFLKKELKRTKHILTFGTLGSLNLEHDLDVIATKKPGSKTSDFYKEIHILLDSLADFLKKNYNKKLVRFSMLVHQEEVLKIGGYKKGDLALHLVNYISLPQIEDHWKPNLERKKSVIEILRKHYTPLSGFVDSLFTAEFSKSGNYDSLYTYMNDLDRLHSNYPETFLIKVMNHLFAYILKNAGINKELIAKNKKEARKIFYELLDILDELR